LFVSSIEQLCVKIKAIKATDKSRANKQTYA